jgi:hypothetical protein
LTHASLDPDIIDVIVDTTAAELPHVMRAQSSAMESEDRSWFQASLPKANQFA